MKSVLNMVADVSKIIRPKALSLSISSKGEQVNFLPIHVESFTSDRYHNWWIMFVGFRNEHVDHVIKEVPIQRLTCTWNSQLKGTQQTPKLNKLQQLKTSGHSTRAVLTTVTNNVFTYRDSSDCVFHRVNETCCDTDEMMVLRLQCTEQHRLSVRCDLRQHQQPFSNITIYITSSNEPVLHGGRQHVRSKLCTKYSTKTFGETGGLIKKICEDAYRFPDIYILEASCRIIYTY